MVQAGTIVRPHGYLDLWLACRRRSTEMYRPLPYSGGVTDQPWEVMWAFDTIDVTYDEEIKLLSDQKNQAQDREALRQKLLAQMKS